jgi:hypothetical protein
MTVEDYIEKTAITIATILFAVLVVVFFMSVKVTAMQQIAVLFVVGAGTWCMLYAGCWVFFKIISKLKFRK